MFASETEAKNKAFWAEQDEQRRFRDGYLAQAAATKYKAEYDLEAFTSYTEEKALSLASTSREVDIKGEQRLAQLMVEHELKIEAMVQGAKHSDYFRELEHESKGQDFISEKGIRGVERSGREWGSLPLGTQLSEKLVIAAESASQIPGLSKETRVRQTKDTWRSCSSEKSRKDT